MSSFLPILLPSLLPSFLFPSFFLVSFLPSSHPVSFSLTTFFLPSFNIQYKHTDCLGTKPSARLRDEGIQHHCCLTGAYTITHNSCHQGKCFDRCSENTGMQMHSRRQCFTKMQDRQIWSLRFTHMSSFNHYSNLMHDYYFT